MTQQSEQLARVLSLLTIVAVVAGCATTAPVEDAPMPSVVAPMAHTAFIPANYVARVHFDEGRYANLVAPTTHAVWVDKTMAEIKLVYEQQQGDVSAGTIENAELIGEHYLIFECHVETLFPDASVGFDISSLRGLDVYVETSEGKRVYPMQQLIVSGVDEEQVGALKRFNRSNLIIFPLVDVISGAPTFPSGSGSVRLVLEGFGSTFSFTWIAQEPIPPDTEPDTTPQDFTDVIRWRPTETETYQVLKVGFTDLFEKLRALTRLPRNEGSSAS